MLLSFVYYTSILGQAIGTFGSNNRHMRPSSYTNPRKPDKPGNGVRRRRFSTGSCVSRESYINENTRLINGLYSGCSFSAIKAGSVWLLNTYLWHY